MDLDVNVNVDIDADMDMDVNVNIDIDDSIHIKNFNFKKYRPLVFTIEHNFTELQLKIDELMFMNNYIRVFIL